MNIIIKHISFPKSLKVRKVSDSGERQEAKESLIKI